MLSRSVVRVFLLALLCVGAVPREPETPDWRMTLKTIRNGIHKIDTYLNAALDLFGGDDGLCHYRCSDGNMAASLSSFNTFSTSQGWICDCVFQA